jgi:hypothetical protein
MLLVRFLAVLPLALFTPLHATIITTANVQAQVPTAGYNCNLTSTGAPVRCSFGIFPTVESDASASAGFGGVAITAYADSTSTGFGTASASARATYDALVEVEGGSGTGILIGRYFFNETIGGSPIGFLSGDIVQGDASTNVSISHGGGPIFLTSDFTYGIPFELTMFLEGDASTPATQTLVEADFEQSTFTDPNGNPLVVVPVPEPGSFAIFSFISGIGALRWFKGRSPIQDQTNE